MSRNMTFEQAQEQVREFLEKQRKDWTQIDNHFYLFTHLSEEMGELARDMINAYFKWTDRETRKPILREKIISRIEDDLGDLVYHLFKLAIAHDIDLGEAFQKAMDDIRKRYGKE